MKDFIKEFITLIILDFVYILYVVSSIFAVLALLEFATNIYQKTNWLSAFMSLLILLFWILIGIYYYKK